MALQQIAAMVTGSKLIVMDIVHIYSPILPKVKFATYSIKKMMTKNI